MKKILIPIIMCLISCSNRHKSQSNSGNDILTNSSEKSTNDIDTLKKINEVKLVVLDSRYEKAEMLLGKPDIRGRVMMGHFYYVVYFNKVKDGSLIKHLVLLVDGDSGISNESPVYRIEAVSDGQTLYGVGNSAQNLKVSQKGLESNSAEFLSKVGTSNWIDVF